MWSVCTYQCTEEPSLEEPHPNNKSLLKYWQYFSKWTEGNACSSVESNKLPLKTSAFPSDQFFISRIHFQNNWNVLLSSAWERGVCFVCILLFTLHTVKRKREKTLKRATNVSVPPSLIVLLPTTRTNLTDTFTHHKFRAAYSYPLSPPPTSACICSKSICQLECKLTQST